MTIASETSRVSYSGNGSTTTFSAPFTFFQDTDLKVYTNTDGTAVLQLLGTDYTVTGAGVDGGGTVVFVAAPASGVIVIIFRDPPLTQTTSYNDNDPFPASSHEDALDKALMLDQRTRELVARSLHLSDSDLPGSGTYDAGGQPIGNVAAGSVAGDVVTFDQLDTLLSTTSVNLFSTRAVAAAATIAVSTTYLLTAGFSTAGDGGHGLYKRVVSDPGYGGFQSAGGIWWALVSQGRVSVKQFGAVGDGATDDLLKIQEAVNYLEALGAGVLIFPPGNPFLVSDSIVNTSAAAVIFQGSGVTNSSIMTRADKTALTINGPFSRIEDLYIIGKGANTDTGTFSATLPAVVMNGVSSRMCRTKVQGGTGTSVTRDDVYLEDVDLSQSYGTELLTGGAVTFLSRGKLDHAWPVSQPAAGTNFSAWASTHAYVVGDVVSVTTGGHTWYIQCSTSGTSGGSAPTLKNYDVPISDGSVTWKLVGRSDMDGIRVNANEFHGESTDLSGAMRYGVFINGGIYTFLDNFIIGQQWSGSIFASTGQRLYVENCELNTGLNTSSAAVKLGASWTGDASISNNGIVGALSTTSVGVDIAGGVDARVRGNYIKSCDSGVIARAGVTDFIIDGNSITGCGTAVAVEAGASNNYDIIGNIVRASTIGISDLGTGTSKILYGNGPSPQWGSIQQTKTTNYTVVATDSTVIFNGAGSITVTLPTASVSAGRRLTLKTIAAQTVVSASSNVVPLIGGSAGTAILAATAGKWADLECDGTNWIIMRSN